MDNNNLYGQEPSGQQFQSQPVYQGNQAELEEPVKMGEWLIALLIMMIPCVNIVMMFVWAFSKSEKKSKSNFFKAYLVYFAIMIGISVILYATVFATIMAAYSSYLY